MPIFRARLDQVQQDAQADFDTGKRETRKEWEARGAALDFFAMLVQSQWRWENLNLQKQLSILLVEIKQLRDIVV